MPAQPKEGWTAYLSSPFYIPAQDSIIDWGH